MSVHYKELNLMSLNTIIWSWNGCMNKNMLLMIMMIIRVISVDSSAPCFIAADVHQKNRKASKDRKHLHTLKCSDLFMPKVMPIAMMRTHRLY